jgi:hypothetical protein
MHKRYKVADVSVAEGADFELLKMRTGRALTAAAGLGR